MPAQAEALGASPQQEPEGRSSAKAKHGECSAEENRYDAVIHWLGASREQTFPGAHKFPLHGNKF
jgi:hypothetical protein